MIFEDIVPKDYSVVGNRSASMDELKAALKQLAKWHAVNHKLLKEQPKLIDNFQYDLTTLPNFLEQDFIRTSLSNFIYMLGNIEELTDYRTYFEALRGKLIDRWVGVIREYRENRQANGYYVLCHDDFHLRNMMFKGLECMLLECQLSYIGSMANEVIYDI